MGSEEKTKTSNILKILHFLEDSSTHQKTKLEDKKR